MYRFIPHILQIHPKKSEYSNEIIIFTALQGHYFKKWNEGELLGLKLENRSKQEKTVLLQQLDKKMVSVLFIRRIALEFEHLGESEFIF